MSNYEIKTSDFVNVSVTSPQDSVGSFLERKFNKSLTVAETKVSFKKV